jgi:imidazolonepropionase-like amidohydrolase
MTGGLSAMRVVQSATLHAAEAMGLGDEAGSIERGKWGDAIVLSSDPLENIDALVAPEVVIQAGEIVHQK